MVSRYKVIISNRNIYKEVDLLAEVQQVKIGTETDCDYRLRKDLFFDKIDLSFVNNGEFWSVICSDNLYLDTGDLRKMLTKRLNHGEIFTVKYQDSNNEVFSVEFVIDFDNGRRRYERAIDVSSLPIIRIGTDSSNQIRINSPFVMDDSIELQRNNQEYVLKVFRSSYGVYVNGAKSTGNAVIRNGDFFSISDFIFYIKDGYLWTEIRDGIYVSGISYGDYPERNSYPKFNRNSRVKTVVCEDKIEILDPPALPQKPKSNIFMKLLPSLGMLVASGVMAAFGGMMIIMSAISGGIAIFTTIMSIREERKEYKTSVAQRSEKYSAYIEKKRQEIQLARNQEKQELEEIYVSQTITEQRFREFSPDLFDRSSEDEDFLCVRLGNGDVKSKREVNYKKQEKLEIEDEFQLYPEKIYEEYFRISGAPIVCDLKEHNAIGVIGSLENRFSILKNVVVDIAARQYFSDVRMVFVANNEHKEYIQWLRLLPHVYNDEVGVRNIVTDDESKNIVFEYLYKELTYREQNKTHNGNIVVFFFDEYGFKSHPVSKFIGQAKELGVTFVFFGEKTSDIPQGCGNIISIVDNSNAVLVNTENKAETLPFTYSSISTTQAQSIVELLAPVYTEAISLEGSLTKNISMFELLNILAVDDIDLKDRWRKSQVFKSMSAPLGVSKTGIVSLDLHDKAHGPHGLVAGTTGSGKSEILQTYILAMATLFHPHEVGFVIIDFKGGGMVNQFKDLPHLMGAITNIDGKEINRSLKSIKAELQKRQRLFADADVNHIDKYIKKYKANEVSVPLPHLIIIVDEFAELKAEQPEFMKELISAARIGRSLGVHLILATQKPSGQVNEQIWSNSRFKLCLKVQSQEDSNEVLKSPLAAEIKEPGRAYLQVGNNEIFELFQSAYSGASEKIDDANVKEFSVFSLTETGKRIPIYTQKKNKSGDGNVTQLDAIVNYISNYCTSIDLEKLPNICLPSLEHTIDFSLVDEKGVSGFIADIGIYDDPDNQYQGVYSIDVGNRNLMIIGSSQSGKTNLLQNIIRSISTKYSPDEVVFYIVDFASMVLRSFEKLNHVGGVVCPSDDEKLKNLFKLLNTEIKNRKERLMSVGVSSFSAYRDAGMTDIPQIVLMIDNLTALKEMYFQDDDELLNLCREGLTVGVSVIISNSQTTGIGYKYLSNFAERIAFFCNDSNEYSSLFDHCSERIENIHGRCIVDIEKHHLECQTYLAFKGEKEIDRVKEIKAFIAATNEQYKNSYAFKIPLIPESLTKNYIVEQFGYLMKDKFNIVSGLDYSTVTPCVVDFSELGLLAVTGRDDSSKYSWIRYSADMLNTMYPGKSKFYVIDSIGKKLASIRSTENIIFYSVVAEDAVTYIREIESELKHRYDALVSGNECILDDSETIVMVIDNQDALTAICNNREALESYKNVVGRYRNMKVAIIAFIDNISIPYSAPEILKNIRDQRHILFFDDMSNMKIFDVPLVMSRKFKKPIETGDGYYFKDNECIKLKTAFVGDNQN